MKQITKQTNGCLNIFKIRIIYLFTFKDSPQDAVRNCLSGSGLMGSIFFLNSKMTASIINVMRYGGLPNFLTVAISAALIVWKRMI